MPTKLLTVEYMYYDDDREAELQSQMESVMSKMLLHQWLVAAVHDASRTCSHHVV